MNDTRANQLSEPKCPACGGVITADAPLGLCPKCLMREAFENDESPNSAGPTPTAGAPLGGFGNYDLLEELGHGGMGVVYKARQRSLHREVALKMLLGGQFAGKVALARFRAEAELAAQLQHPNIVAIHEIGEQDGLPYFTMDYVPGRSLVDLVRDHPLPARSAAAYVQIIAKAIHYAHEQGVLHRDLKPSNILIDAFDQPRLTDFGLAKRLTGSTSDLTVSGQALGSPNFMPPEQAAGKHKTSGPTSDIYGLGAVLYYLITGRPPFMAENASAAVRQVLENDPVSPRVLNPNVPRDLETLCLKCLQKEPKQRYASAQAVADELGRFLRGEPIQARPVSTVTQVWRWCRRKPVLAALAVAVAALSAVSTTTAVRALRAEKLAGQRLVESEKARAEAEAIAKSMTEIFQSPAPERDGRTITVAETLDTAVKKLETDLANQPARRAQLQATLGTTYYALGLFREAIALHEKVRDYNLANSGPEHTNTLQAMGKLAISYFGAGRRDEALKLQEEALILRRKVNGPEHTNTLVAMGNLAALYSGAGRRSEALKLQEEELILSRKVNGPEHPGTLSSMHNLAISYAAAGRRDEALKLREEVLLLRRKVHGPEHPDTLRAMLNLALSSADAGRRDEVLKLQEEALPLIHKVFGPEHPDTLSLMGNLAVAYAKAGRRDEALKLREEVLSLRRKVSGAEHPDTLWAMSGLASSYSDAGRRDEALKLREEALMLHRKVLGPEHPETLSAMHNLALSYADAGRREEALKLREEVLPLRRKVNGAEHPDTLRAMGGLAESYAGAGRRDEALKLREEALTLHRKVQGPEHPDTLGAMDSLAGFYFGVGRRSEALKLQQEVLTLHRKVLGPEHPDTLVAMKNLALAYDGAGRQDEALKLREEVLPLRRKVQGPEHPDTLSVMSNLADAYAKAGRRDEALKMREEVLPLARKVLGPEHPDTLTAMNNLAFSYSDAGRRDEALKLVQEALPLLKAVSARNPADTIKTMHVAIVHLWLGETNEHRAICRKLLAFAANSKDPTAHDRAARAYLLQAHSEEEMLKQAVAAGRQALKLAATNDPYRGWFRVTAALAAIREGAPAEAEPLLTEVLDVPGGNRALRCLALACRVMARTQLGRTNEVRADFAELEKSRPAFPSHPTPSAILLIPDAMAVCLAYEEARTRLNAPRPAKP